MRGLLYFLKLKKGEISLYEALAAILAVIILVVVAVFLSGAFSDGGGARKVLSAIQDIFRFGRA